MKIEIIKRLLEKYKNIDSSEFKKFQVLFKVIQTFYDNLNPKANKLTQDEEGQLSKIIEEFSKSSDLNTYELEAYLTIYEELFQKPDKEVTIIQAMRH